jgi:hypothetical protein
MKWTYITDDPNTLPPLDTPVFVLMSDGQCLACMRSVTCGDGWLWAVAYYSPRWYKGAWQLDDAETDDVIGIAWHPLPELPTENKP